MKLAETPEEQRAWMAQWRAAEKALLEVKRQELRALTEEQAQLDSVTLLSMISFPRSPSDRDQSSGLIEQQRWFAQAKCYRACTMRRPRCSRSAKRKTGVSV